MPASNQFLTPYPPTLFSPPEKQVISGSTNSFSSSSSSSNSRSMNYFERLSHTSSASAYLTDLTPPITPSNSNCKVESKHGNYNRVVEERPNNEKRQHPLVRSTIIWDKDVGYRSDNEEDSSAFDAVADFRSRILKSKKTLNSRRTLRLMEDHNDPETGVVGSEDGCVEVPLLAVEAINNQAVVEVAEADEEVEREYFDEANFSRDFDSAMGLIYQEAMNGTYVDTYVGPVPEHQFPVPDTDIPAFQDDLLCELSNMEVPAKPIILPTELDFPCSPMSLCDDPSFESSASISRSLLSTIQLDANILPSSPAIYNESFSHGNSPLSSPHVAISTLMFAARGERRSFPIVDLTGENLDIASLIRLEVAASNNAIQSRHQLYPIAGLGLYMPPQSHLPPSPSSSFSSLHDHSFNNAIDQSPCCGPFKATSSQFLRESSPDQHQHESAVDSGEDLQVRDIPTTPLPVDPDQPLVGLGLGVLAEGCLGSSASISKPDQGPRPIVASDADMCISNVPPDNQQCSPCVILTASDLRTEIEPSDVLSSLQSLQSLPSHISRLYQEVQNGVSDTQVNLNNHASQVSIEEQFSCFVENVSGDIVESEIESIILSDSLPPANVFHNSVTSARRCSIESHKKFPQQHSDREGDVTCKTPLIVQGPTFTGEDALYLFDRVPITPDSTKLQFTSSALAESSLGVQPPTTPRTDDTPKQSIEHSSLLFQDSPLHHLTQVLGSIEYLTRFNWNQAPPASTTASVRKELAPNSMGSSLTPRNDPRSPYSPSVEYFHPESYILGCQGVLPSAPNSSGPNALPSSSSKRDPAAFSSFSGLLRESKSVEGLGLGLPSDLVSRPLRQHDSPTSRPREIDGLDGMSTTQECQNIAQLANLSSPNGGKSDTSPRVFFKVPRFVQRRLYVIPEQPTPSPTFSAGRSRTPSPLSQPSSSTWSGVSVFKRLRSLKRLSWLTFSSKRRGASGEGVPTRNGHPNLSLVDGGLRSSTEHDPTPSTKSKNLFQRCFRVMAPSSASASSLSPPQPASAGSPGVIEHLDVPRDVGILKRRSRGRLEPITRKFQVLF